MSSDKQIGLLLVDDDPTVLYLIQLLLADRAATIAFTTPESAYEYFAYNHHYIDCILMDYSLGRGEHSTGIHLLQRITEFCQQKHLALKPTVLLSGYTADTFSQPPIWDRFVTKPFDGAYLWANILGAISVRSNANASRL